MSGTVIVCADEAGRFSAFAASMQGLLIPEGGRALWLIGNDFSGNRNIGCQKTVDADGDWVFFMDDDHVFAADVLLRLLDHDVDIVAPLVARRQQPFSPVAQIDGIDIDLTRCPGGGLLEVDATGSAGMLIRRRVLDELEPPWFQLEDGRSEDFTFCRKARAAGFSVRVDLSLAMGHVTTCAVWPVYSDGRWYTGYTVGDGFKLMTDVCVDALAGGV